jgi:hypothetical protein
MPAAAVSESSGSIKAWGRGEKGQLTDVGGDTANDDLRLVSGNDGLPELLVVPGVDLAVALDVRCIPVPIHELAGQGSVGAGLSRRCHDDGQVKDLAELCMSVNVALVERRVPVTGDLEETFLQVKNQKQLYYPVSTSCFTTQQAENGMISYRIVLVQLLKGESADATHKEQSLGEEILHLDDLEGGRWVRNSDCEALIDGD